MSLTPHIPRRTIRPVNPCEPCGHHNLRTGRCECPTPVRLPELGELCVEYIGRGGSRADSCMHLNLPLARRVAC
jgi:hypothetical protein